MSTEKTVRIGCHSGFWGDSAYNANQLVEKGNIDYLVSDYLAETTMSIMGAQMMRNPDAGYAPDFIQTIKPLLKQIKAQGIRVITNAGGMNSTACRDALLAAAAEADVELNVALVEGDNLMPRADEIRGLGVTEMGSGDALPEKITSMNAYIGSPAIQVALDAGADIVMCGRCTDSAVVVGALMHEFGWGQQDNDLLSAACLAGHGYCQVNLNLVIFETKNSIPQPKINDLELKDFTFNLPKSFNLTVPTRIRCVGKY